MIPKIRWSMLFSHHPPCDYDRTWRIGSLQICVRCLGVLIGTIFALICFKNFSKFPVMGVFLAALPGVTDFILHELHLSTSNGIRRFLTGAIFGIFVAALCSAAVDMQFVRFGLFLFWFFILQFATALILRLSGRLEPLLARYENAVFFDHVNKVEDITM